MGYKLNDILSLKLIDNDIKDFKDEDICTNLFEIFINLFEQAYPDIYTKNFSESQQFVDLFLYF